MDNSYNNAGYLCTIPLTDARQSVEIGADYTLPDYLPEIRRLLGAHSCVRPRSQFSSNGSLTLDGNVTHKILYLGADGLMWSATLTDKYECSFPLSFDSHCASDQLSINTFCDCEHTDARVIGPRKLNVRAKLACSALVLADAMYYPEMKDAHTESELQTKVDECRYGVIVSATGEEQTLSDFINIDTPADDLRVIDAYVGFAMGECFCTDGSTVVRGDAVLRILYCNDNESEIPLTLTKKLPISCEIPCEGVDSGFECTAHAYFDDEHFEITENGISVTLSVFFKTVAQKNQVANIITDAYSTERRSECNNGKLNTLSAVKCTFGALTKNDVFSLSETKLPTDSRIIDVMTNPTVEECSVTDGKALIKGTCEYTVIFHSGGEYMSAVLSAPYKYEIDHRGKADSAASINCRATVRATSSRGRCDTERLLIDCELAFNAMCTAEMEHEYLESVSFLEPLEVGGEQMVLCFPERGATLWSIAKRYSKPAEQIKEQNSLGESSDISKKRFLIV